MKKIIIITFIWIGFIGAISFMESWLKFQAPNITTKLGLGIGKLVFGALNILEVAFTLIITSIILLSKKQQISYVFLIVVFVVALQTFWMLPTLNERAELIIKDIQVPKSKLHFLYVLAEVIKVSCLFFFGINQFKKLTIK
ncbi:MULTISPECIES: hypothetical protein [Tenacibaculum]|uniref:hypothetical protein n=1 Tax=Tenacibaculum TaxID=104267 RepID=UPI0021AE592B|nr:MULTISPECIES: hypothetical protein [Tenacibaculum]MCT4699911.1 hypothetical protein [Tenacibaculum haliotis]WBX70926.1 hypothetical protein PG912_11980 [Tenacibaculum retecalamus]